jgi:hypothetical protein
LGSFKRDDIGDCEDQGDQLVFLGPTLRRIAYPVSLPVPRLFSLRDYWSACLVFQMQPLMRRKQ